jgi:hypothetical protein
MSVRLSVRLSVCLSVCLIQPTPNNAEKKKTEDTKQERAKGKIKSQPSLGMIISQNIYIYIHSGFLRKQNKKPNTPICPTRGAKPLTEHRAFRTLENRGQKKWKKIKTANRSHT